MTPKQREAAERLAEALRTWPAAFAPTGIMFETAALLRELAEEPVDDMQKALKDAQHTADFYRRRVQALEQWQSRMRDPERTVVCDILANGFTLDPPVPHDRYALAAEPVQEPVAAELPAPQLLVESAQGFVEGWTRSQVRSAINLALLKRRYAAPQQRKPLTNRQAIALWADRSDGPANHEIISFARAIERAHDIKETP